MTDLFTGTEKEQEAKIDKYNQDKRDRLRMVLNDPRFGFDDPPRLFFKKMYTFNPQLYGPRIQNWLIEKAELDKVDTAKERGDASNSLKAYFEFKASYKTPRNSFNFIQVRRHHKVHGYCFIAIDPDKEFEETYFYLTRDQALYEAYNIGSSAHGKDGDPANKKPEKKLSIREGTLDYARWMRMYRVPDFEILKKILAKKPFGDESRARYGKKYRQQDKRSIWNFVKSKTV